MKFTRKLLATLNGRVCCLLLVCCDAVAGAEDRVLALTGMMMKRTSITKPQALAASEFVLSYFGLVPHEVEAEVAAVVKATSEQEEAAAGMRLVAAIKSTYAPYLAQAKKERQFV